MRKPGLQPTIAEPCIPICGGGRGGGRGGGPNLNRCSDYGVFKRPDVRYHAVCGAFKRPCPLPCYLRCSQAPRASAAYYVCTTKVDCPATEAPGVRGVLRLYYKSRLSSHGSSGRPGVLHLPRKAFLCDHKTLKHDGFGAATTRKPGLRLYVRKRKNTTVLAPRQRRNPQRVDPHPQKCAKHDGFSTATRRLPAEGCPRPQET